jgi:hypothetical protein
VHTGSSSLQTNKGTEKITVESALVFDSEEGLAGNTKYFEEDENTFVSVALFDPDTVGSSNINYPTNEMSVVVHVSPDAYADDASNPLYIAAFTEASDQSLVNDPAAWGIYLDNEGHVNVFVTAGPPSAAYYVNPNHYEIYLKHIELKSSSKLNIDGTPTSIIVTVDSHLNHGNVKLYINGSLEDQSGLRLPSASLTAGTDVNNWPSKDTGLGGEAIWHDTNTNYYLTIGAKSSNNDDTGYHSFKGKIEEFVWYDKCIYPVSPKDGKMVLTKPLEELMSSSLNSSSQTYNARLFVRGKTSGEVAASSQISFKKAAFELRTN